MKKFALAKKSLAVVGGLATMTALLSPPAQAAGPSYVALGDSYSSGTGTRTYYEDGTSCKRSPYAYPSLISAARSYALNFRACSGATTADVTNTQLGALSGSTNYVSISIGGNDAGFADVMTTCAMPSWMSNCNGRIDTAENFVKNTLPGRLRTLYTSIRSKAPNAKVVVVGYPRIFMGEDCNAGTWFSPQEQSRLNAMADLINSKTKSIASAKGFAFADPTGRFIGHAVCDDPEWINGLSNPIDESYHPNIDGQRSGYTPTVSPVLTGANLTVTSTTMSQALLAAEEQETLQREYAAADRTIEPKSMKPVDLHSKAALAAARRAGVDVNDRASVDRADRIWAERQARAYANR